MAKVFELEVPEFDAYNEALARAKIVTGRLTEIARTLPDATEKERTKLLAEQGALHSEAFSLPATVGELARRGALAHLAALEARYFELDHLVEQLSPQLEVLQATCLRLQKAQRANATANVHDQAAFIAAGQRLGKEGRELDAQRFPVEVQLNRARLEQQAQVIRARQIYGVQMLLNHADWPRCAHFFGEMQRRQADHELHGNFDSLVTGPGRPRPRVPRSNALPAA